MKMHTLVLTLAVGLLLSLGASAQKTPERSDPPRTQGSQPVGATGMSQPGRMAPVGLQAQTPLREFPTDTFFPSETFNERQIQSLERAGIRNVGQLIEADPRRLGQSLGLNPREVEAAQRKMQASLEAGPERQQIGETEKNLTGRMAPVEMRPQTPLREFPTDTFFPSETFNERQIQSLERAGIRNVGQLIEADPRRLGQTLGLDPREVQAAQQKIRGSLR